MAIPLSQYLAAVQAAMAPQSIDIDQGQLIMPPETITPAGMAPPIAPPPAAAPAYQSPVGSSAAPAPAAPPPGPQSRFLPPDAFGPPANPIEAGVKLAQSRGDLPPDAPPPGTAPAQAEPQAPQL